LLNASDKSNAVDVLPTKQPKSALRARRAIEQPLFLVKADGIHAQAGLLRDPTDLDAVPHHL